MKTYHLFILAGCLLLSSCLTPMNYLGDKFTPTTSVDIYYSAHDVTKPYKVIGHLTYPNSGQEYTKAKFIEYAKKIGADALIITGTEATADNSAGLEKADALKYGN